MKQCRIFILLMLLFIIISCGKKVSPYAYTYDRNETEYHIIQYYMKENLTEKIAQNRLQGLVEYYRVYINRHKAPIKEEYYKSGVMRSYKIYHYADLNKANPLLKSIEYYNQKKLIIKEELYKNGVINVYFTYHYHPTAKYLIYKKRYKKNILDGWSGYFNQSGKETKREYYKNGMLERSFIYLYDANGKRTLEKAYNQNNQLLYKHSY